MQTGRCMSTRPASTSAAQALATIAHTFARHVLASLFTCTGDLASVSPALTWRSEQYLAPPSAASPTGRAGSHASSSKQAGANIFEKAVRPVITCPRTPSLISPALAQALSGRDDIPRGASRRPWQCQQKRKINCNQTHAGTDRARACVCRPEL